MSGRYEDDRLTPTKLQEIRESGYSRVPIFRQAEGQRRGGPRLPAAGQLAPGGKKSGGGAEERQVSGVLLVKNLITRLRPPAPPPPGGGAAAKEEELAISTLLELSDTDTVLTRSHAHEHGI